MGLTRQSVPTFLEAGPEDLVELASARLPFSLDDFDEQDTMLWADESVTLAELVLAPNVGVIVRGDLFIEGMFDGRPLHEDETPRFMLVSGDLRARQALIGCEAHIDGSVVIEDTLIAESDGHSSLKVAGALRARHIIALGHHVTVKGATTADFKIGCLGLASDAPKSQMAASFRSEFVNQYGGIEIDAVADAVLAGTSPFSLQGSNNR